MATQRIVADYYAANGFPFATDAGAGRPGRDILGVLGIADEVKARRGFVAGAAMRQVVDYADGDLPVVTLRLDGMGPASVGDWLKIVRFSDFITLIRRAGYGEPIPGTDNETVVKP